VPAYLDKTFVSRFLPDRYTELAHLGAGGMGVVFKGFDKETKTKIALKVLSPLVQDNPNAVKRFLIEARTLQSLDHPSLVRVTDIQKEPLSYFAMELVEGTPLDEMISEGQGLDPKKAVDIVTKVADVLGYVHSRGLVHRDIKPSNIMVLASGGVKLLDFGLVHDEGQTAITKTGDVLGTLKYMAPEQFAGGKCSPATDVYSLTVVLCQLLTGTVPPRLGHFHQPPTEFLATTRLPRPFIEALDRAMEVDSTQRPVDGAELAKRLKEIRSVLDTTRAY
jgi:eukaryotic-like serine/threonine-protein kinase